MSYDDKDSLGGDYRLWEFLEHEKALQEECRAKKSCSDSQLGISGKGSYLFLIIWFCLVLWDGVF